MIQTRVTPEKISPNRFTLKLDMKQNKEAHTPSFSKGMDFLNNFKLTLSVGKLFYI